MLIISGSGHCNNFCKITIDFVLFDINWEFVNTSTNSV